ncbi:hypothetical protein GPLA_4343 [Paraglaciecola polaris LMG 21857]|uniref:Uncharacterized protein n=1 Tax=Paraglaciecola polaris LMG 21857 TaxID=1129793 RepID=K6ZYB9_9ALTE|nr:hypothetical protein GPLA_4343 [Paraglaciecola polaris LMG 21857]
MLAINKIPFSKTICRTNVIYFYYQYVFIRTGIWAFILLQQKTTHLYFKLRAHYSLSLNSQYIKRK